MFRDIKAKVVKEFANLNNPETATFINQINDMNAIYNHTKEICFDTNNLYLVTDVAYS